MILSAINAGLGLNYALMIEEKTLNSLQTRAMLFEA